MRAVTLAAPSSLPRALALGRSLRRHQARWSHEILLLGRAEPSLAGDADAASRVHSVCDVLDIELEPLLALHDEEELTSLLVPALLRRCAQLHAEPVVHLPRGAWVLADLSPIQTALASRPVLLAARTSEELPDDGLEPSPEQLARVGSIEASLIGVDGSARCEEFLAWWQGRVEQMLGSLDTRASGARPEDRHWLARYLELAPAGFSAAVLEDPGSNLNVFNLHLHRLELDGNGAGVLVDGHWPLRFLNLPGFDPDRPHRLDATATRARVSRSPALHLLCERYARELRESGWRDSDHRGEVGRILDGWLVFDESLRAIYVTACALGADIGDPLGSEDARAFIVWLQSPAPKGGAHGINRYLFHRVARERPDVMRAYPDLDGPDGAEYVAWCWAFGRHELALPERFLPPLPGRGAPLDAGADTRSSVATARVALPPRRKGGSPRGRSASARNARRNGRDASADGLAVRLTGYLGHTLGLGAAARGYAHALAAAGVPVRTVTVPLHHLQLPVELDDGYGRQGFEDLVHDGAHGFEIVAVNAEELPDLVARLGEGYFEGPRIGIWGWETNSIPPHWQEAFALIDEIWVYSRFMAENIGAVAPVPVSVLPPPVERPQEPAAPLRLGVPEGFLFLFVFDYMSTVQRKNPVGLIEAFKRAFAPGEGPQLLIKTINAPLRPLAEEEVLWHAHGRSDIRVVDRSLSRAELNGVLAACDCYVSLHRSEGFGLTMAEAMAAGKPVIATGYSGNVDFMNAGNSHLIANTIGRVGAECEIYPPEGEWAEPSVEHAAQLMRRVCGDREESAHLGARAAADIQRTLSAKSTGEAMRRRLEELARTGAPASRAQVLAGSEPGAAPPGASSSSHS